MLPNRQSGENFFHRYANLLYPVIAVMFLCFSSPMFGQSDDLDWHTSLWPTDYDDFTLELYDRDFGQSVAVGDVNGDNFDDIVVCSDFNIWVYKGPVQEQVSWTWDDPILRIGTGYSTYRTRYNSLALADVNDDGIMDIIFGEDAYNQGDSPWFVHVFYGDEDWDHPADPLQPYIHLLESDADWTQQSPSTTDGGSFGASLARAGDVNSDGIDDIIIGAPTDSDNGRTYVFYGSPSGLPADHLPDAITPPGDDWNIWIGGIEHRLAGFGMAVSRDGHTTGTYPIDNFIVGAPYTDIDLDDNGYISTAEQDVGSVLFGPRYWAVSGDNTYNTRFGYALGNAGDVNGDGHPEVLIAARRWSVPAKIFLYLGDDDRVDFSVPYQWSVTNIPYCMISSATCGYKPSLGSAGDINDDSYGDIFIGDPSYNPDATYGGDGRVHIWFGGPSSTSDPSGLGPSETAESADILLTPADMGGFLGNMCINFGYSVAAGDINGDGLTDLVVGDPGTWHPYEGTDPGVQSGAVHVFVNTNSPPSGTNLGNTTVYGSTTTSDNRRAMQVTFPESGIIQSISIYHNGGGDDMLLGVYADASGAPGSRLGITPSTTVSSSAGWQTVNLNSPVAVAAGQTVWLAWVFEDNPGIRYSTGTPARAQSSDTWSGGMPSPFGASTMANYRYSLYCTYIAGGVSNFLEVSPTTLTLVSGSGATGTFDISSNTSWSISDNASWLTVSPTSGSNDGTITVTATSANTGSSARTATVTVSGTGVSSKTVTVTQSPASSGSTLGNLTIYGSTTTNANRRAMQVTIPENGIIQSISIYHNGGGGGMLLGVYADASGSPGNRLGLTPATTVNSSMGWQTVNLGSPVSVSSGQTVWLAWVFEDNPGIRYSTGTPARAHSSDTWSGGMPSSFGSSSMANYRYSLYCTYTPGGTADYLEVSPTSLILASGSGATGNFNISSNTSWSITDNASWLTVSPTSGANNQNITVTATSANTGSSARSATVTVSGSGVASKTVSVTQNPEGSGSTLGNTTVYGSSTTNANRRAMQVTFPENGTIESISIYHNGGGGGLLLGVYEDASGSPGARLGVTPTTTVSSSAGWQTISLGSPVSVSAGQTVWLAWVFQSNPGLRYITGTPARAHSSDTWSGGMPSSFGSSTMANYKYSLYCTYTPGGSSTVKLGNQAVYGSSTTNANRRAMQVTSSVIGSIQSISIYHNGGGGNLLLGVYADASGTPGSRLGLTPSTAVSSSSGWQTVNLSSPVSISAGQTVWLAWVFEDNPGLRFTTGTPARAHSSDTWSGGMPSSFGSSTMANYKYSLYCTVTTGGSKAAGANLVSDVSLSQENLDETFLIYPNPTNGEINVIWNNDYEQGLAMTLINAVGEIVRILNIEPDQQEVRLNLGDYNAGLYLLMISNPAEERVIHRARIVKIN